MAKQPDSNQSYQDRSFHDTHESLEALARLLARQLAREHFTRSTQHNKSKDQSGASNTGGTKDE